MVRAKFQVTNKREWETTVWDSDKQESVPTTLHSVELCPVYGDSEENKKFWQATPAGAISISCTFPEVGEKFEIGKSYYVDFTPADGE